MADDAKVCVLVFDGEVRGVFRTEEGATNREKWVASARELNCLQRHRHSKKKKITATWETVEENQVTSTIYYDLILE